MNKNTFLLHKAKMQAKNNEENLNKSTINNEKKINQNVEKNEENINRNEKYNPDVLKKYLEINQEKNRKIKMEYVPEYYKTITNQPIKEKITSIEELKLERDKPDINNSILNYNNTLNNRLLEKSIVKKSIEEYKNKNNIKNKTVEELDEEYQEKLKIKENKNKNKNNNINNIKEINNINIQYIEEGRSFIKLRDECKIYTINEKDKILEQKNRYNNIIESLAGII